MHRGRSGLGGTRGGDRDWSPVANRGLELLENEDIREADRLLSPILEEVRNYHPALLVLLDEAPLKIGAWRRGRTAEDRRCMHWFYRLTNEIEKRLEARNPGVEIFVGVKEPADSPHDARWIDHRRQEEQDLREVYERWIRVQEERGVGPGEAREIMSREHPYISTARTRRAITQENRRRSPGLTTSGTRPGGSGR